MSIHKLTPQNFRIVGHNHKTLNIDIPGNVLVFFKMEGCPGCTAFEPIFYQLARDERRINYGVTNLTNARDVIAMSRSTSTPIKTVPFLILYMSGRPFAKYIGKKNILAMKSFISKALFQVQTPSSQSQNGFMPQQALPQQHGMYGSGGYRHPQMTPQQGQAGFNRQGGSQQSSQGNFWMPEIGKTPSLQGVVKNNGANNYAYLNDLDEEDETKLKLPNHVTPHNVPWESSNYKRLGTVD